tara:strand:- start:439 stop:1044 length:606 start_codon:yes stop_codon:yes gene_type:complete
MSKRNRTIIGSNLSFNDLLFNVLVGFVMLFVIAFLLINPITKKSDIPVKAEFLIVLSWPAEAADDLDLWVQRDSSKPVGFSNRENTPLHLDRDDLGRTNDKVIIDGNPTTIAVNRETTTIRGIVPGDYFVGVHYYSMTSMEDLPYTVTVMKVNPFRELYSITGILSTRREVHQLPAFSIDKDGSVTEIFQHFRKIVPESGN